MTLHVWSDGRWEARDDRGALICEGSWSKNERTLVASAHVTVWNPNARPEADAKRRRSNELMGRAVVQMICAVGALE